MKTKIFALVLTLSILVIGCSKKDSEDNEKFTADEVAMNAKIDMANEDVQNIVESEFEATAANASTARLSSQNATSALPACAIVTRVPAFGTQPTVGQLVTKTINFGTTGCTMPSGNVLKGKIIISFTFNPGALTHTITYQFDGFFHNAIRFDGNRTFTRTMNAATATSPSHPVVVMNMNMTATFPNGNTATRIGTRTREIVEGFATASTLDNIWKITGSWVTTFQNGVAQTATITTPLIVRFNCPRIVGGAITFVRNGNTAILDYGNGDCDNLASVSINGGASVTITLGN
jgi:hypothetical protein